MPNKVAARERFNVWQFFADDVGSECVGEDLTADEACEKFKHYASSIGAKLGTTIRVIITDDGDYTNAEWQFGKGITYPPPPENAEVEAV